MYNTETSFHDGGVFFLDALGRGHKSELCLLIFPYPVFWWGRVEFSTLSAFLHKRPLRSG